MRINRITLPKTTKHGFLRRNDITQRTLEEKIIALAIDSIEGLEAHPLLTEAVNLLSQAKDKLADFLELPPNG